MLPKKKAKIPVYQFEEEVVQVMDVEVPQDFDWTVMEDVASSPFLVGEDAMNLSNGSHYV